MADITEDEKQSLLGGGDCQNHWHSRDAVPTHDTISKLHELARVITITGDYVAKYEDDFIRASGLATITLPPTRSGQEITVVRVGTQLVTVIPVAGDLICGATSVLLTTQWTSLTFKSIGTDWIII